ncbi:MAG TPA: NAD-dependent epimerase/dehydratase family protein [Luteitalea sp.]|nr:NAD-dependent epimerase/dehydratase family protein [Luteitalea sp.]
MSNVAGRRRRVLVTGATGFVGSHLHPVLVSRGYDVLGGTRNVARASQAHPDRVFVHLDLHDPASVKAALDGCDAAFYLVHGMNSGGEADYAKAELDAALGFREAAAAAGLERIVYLGGMRPAGPPSRHLQSRLDTGQCLREGVVPTIELQASMIVGRGSESFRMVRDLAARLPGMLLPRWLRSRTQPIGIADVVTALVHALAMDVLGSVALALPGPETMQARTIIMRIARLLGRRPVLVDVPVLTPWLSSWWIRLVTRSDPRVAAELVEGLRYDIVSPDEGFWTRLPGYRRQPFDEAARLALAGEAEEISGIGAVIESAAEWLTPRDPSAPVPTRPMSAS